MGDGKCRSHAGDALQLVENLSALKLDRSRDHKSPARMRAQSQPGVGHWRPLHSRDACRDAYLDPK